MRTLYYGKCYPHVQYMQIQCLVEQKLGYDYPCY